MQPAVTAIKFEDLIPKVTNKKWADMKLIPTVLVPYKGSFEIKNGNSALANSIRRSIMSEYMTKTYYFLYVDFSSDDVYLPKDMILDRIRLIPINQKVDENATFSLNVRNDTKTIMAVTVKDIVVNEKMSGASKAPIANQQTIIAYLNPGRSFSIKKISIRKSRGYDHASYSVASNVVSLALGEESEKPSSISNPTHHRIEFICNGGVPGRTLISNVCRDLIERFEGVRNLLPTLMKTGNVSALTIRGETDTISALLCKTIYLQNRDINMVTYFNDAIIRMTTIRIVSDNAEPEDLIEGAINLIIKQINSISGAFIVATK